MKSPYYTFVRGGHLNLHSISFMFVVVGSLLVISGVMYTWYNGIHSFSPRMGPTIMGIGLFLILCSMTCMLENKDEHNQHIIIGDCYNNFLYNVTNHGGMGGLPTVISFRSPQKLT